MMERLLSNLPRSPREALALDQEFYVLFYFFLPVPLVPLFLPSVVIMFSDCVLTPPLLLRIGWVFPIRK